MTVADTIKEFLTSWIDEHADLIADIHQQAWEFAELGLREFRTGRLLADTLETAGFTVERGVAGMGYLR